MSLSLSLRIALKKRAGDRTDFLTSRDDRKLKPACHIATARHRRSPIRILGHCERK